MNGTEFTFYNIWTDPLSLMFYGFCAVFLMTNVKPLLEFLLKDIKKEIQKKVENRQS
jgi:hypothetical protein